MLEVAPTRGGQEARDILLTVLRNVIKNLIQRKVCASNLPRLAILRN